MGDVNDIHGLADEIAKERTRLANAVEDGTIHERDRDAIVAFANHRELHDGVKNSTLKKDYEHLRVAASVTDNALVDVSGIDGVNVLLRAIKARRGEDNPLSPSSMHKYRCCLRNFFKHLGRDFWEDIDGSQPKNTTKASVDPGDMLDMDEIAELRKATTNVRDATLIDVLADTAARISLLCTLRVGDVTLDTDRPHFTPNSVAEGLKNVPNKPYPLIDSQASLRTYLNNYHPRSDERDAPLFHKHMAYYKPDEGDDGALGYQTVYSMLKGAKKRSGIEKPVNPHNFRHSAITRMRGEGFTRDEVRHRTGWGMDTQMWERYEHLTANERNDQIFARAGLIDEEETPTPERFPCGNCREILSPSHTFCPNCGEPAHPDVRDAVEEQEDRLFESLAVADGDVAEGVLELRTMLNDSPDLRAFLLDN